MVGNIVENGMSVDPDTITEQMEREAINSLHRSSEDRKASSHHILGDGDESHKLSMLQKITAKRILDYKMIFADPRSPTPELLTEQMKEFEKTLGPRLDLAQVIQSQSPSMALAAEFKRASPSKGDIAIKLTAGGQASNYAIAGASVISILTEPYWFKGALRDLTDARKSTTQTQNNGRSCSRPAILRKDFVFNSYQILEAAAAGADTVLLIVAILPSYLLKELIEFSRSMDMEPLVEVHGDLELDVALKAGAKVIGVNNRNLHTFEMDLSTTDKTAERLSQRGKVFDHNLAAYATDSNEPNAHPPYVLCALSGMSSADDVNRYRRLGVGMCLIGESLMRAPNPVAAISGLCLNPNDFQAMTTSSSGGAYVAGTKVVKVCGITNAEDALVACRSGASLIGVIFAERSKRKVSRKEARSVVSVVRQFGERQERIALALDEKLLRPISLLAALRRKARSLENASCRPLVVGVFQNSSSDEVRTVVEEVGLDLVQLHGDEGMVACGNCGVPAIRVVHINASEANNGDMVENIIASLTSDPVAILLDTVVKGAQGGSGVTFNWNLAKGLQDRGLPVLVAGGLHPGNVEDVVSRIGPWGVDVSSGVELNPKKKAAQKVHTFVVGARKAAQEASKGI